jgi:hypothetical protein
MVVREYAGWARDSKTAIRAAARTGMFLIRRRYSHVNIAVCGGDPVYIVADVGHPQKTIKSRKYNGHRVIPFPCHA